MTTIIKKIKTTEPNAIAEYFIRTIKRTKRGDFIYEAKQVLFSNRIGDSYWVELRCKATYHETFVYSCDQEYMKKLSKKEALHQMIADGIVH